MTNVCFNCDNMELMSKYPENHFELAIVDPPYGINVNMNAGIKAGVQKKFESKNWDKSTPGNEYFEELIRISKNQIIWGGNYFHLPLTQSWVFWDKDVPKGVSFSDGELAWTSFGGALKKVRIPYSGARGSEGKIHPTQKPISLYKWILVNYAKKGDKILDTHVGSGSIRIACYDLGFDFTGCELDKGYWEAQEKRYKNHIQQNDLFEFIGGECEEKISQRQLFDETVETGSN